MVRSSCSATKLFERLFRSCATTPSGGESFVARIFSPWAGATPTRGDCATVIPRRSSSAFSVYAAYSGGVMTRRRLTRGSVPARTRPDTVISVRPPSDSPVSTVAGAGPEVVVTTRPWTTKPADGGSTSTFATAPDFEPGTMVTAIRFPFSDRPAEGARDTDESFFDGDPTLNTED